MTAIEPLVIWGAGGHAAVVADAARCSERYRVVAFVDTVSPERQGTLFMDAPVIGSERELLAARRDGVASAIVAVGDNVARVRLADRLVELGFGLVTIIHPRATLEGKVRLGEGTVAFAASVVNVGAVVGRCVILNTASVVEHDCQVADGAHVGPGAILTGRVRVGRCAWVGAGAVVRDGMAIGDGSVIGAGSVVVKDVPSNVVAYGVPAVSRRQLAQSGD